MSECYKQINQINQNGHIEEQWSNDYVATI